jgi:hypothetical protein
MTSVTPVEDDTFVELVNPVAPAPDRGPAASGRPAPSWSGLANARVSIVENGKANAEDLLEALQGLLVSRYGAIRGITIHKEVSGPVHDEALAALVARSDLVLVGSAD